MDVEFPFRFDEYGRTARAPYDEHVKDMLVQLLLVAPGERVMRPDFGAGLLALVFEPNSTTLAATTQFVVQSALQQHLSGLIAVDAVSVENIDAVLQVTVRYTALADGSAQQAVFAVPGGGP